MDESLFEMAEMKRMCGNSAEANVPFSGISCTRTRTYLDSFYSIW